MVSRIPSTATRREEIIGVLSQGGDERIVVDPGTGFNRYYCSPRPGRAMAFSSTTANDLSSAALEHLMCLSPATGCAVDYSARLEALRHRIGAAYGLDPDTGVVFSPSGTDLEYVALACVPGREVDRGITNILLGADEVGSGCIHSANGRHFAKQTPLGVATTPGATVEGLGAVTIEDIAVRDELGHARTSHDIADDVHAAVTRAHGAGRHALVHVVHGSKTGLVVPGLDDMDRLRTLWGNAATWVVDACQARIRPDAVRAYLERGAIVLMTGSKFVGAPPFCGFALIPPGLVASADPLRPGLSTIFNRAEWPVGWPGAAAMPDGANPGLLLRLEAALFEIERYFALGEAQVRAITDPFGAAVRRLVHRLGVSLIEGDGAAAGSPELQTLCALDLSNLAVGAEFDDALVWHRALVDCGIRLGQPVRSARLPDGRWRPTLRIALSMPMIVERAADASGAGDRFEREFHLIGSALADVAAVHLPSRYGASVAA